ncbi:MAG: hypothetical protein J0M12_04565 [Deltaproteobacteria bacterium]|nr:hypothetical protein [Deltaproteobacteria bacterium]
MWLNSLRFADAPARAQQLLSLAPEDRVAYIWDVHTTSGNANAIPFDHDPADDGVDPVSGLRFPSLSHEHGIANVSQVIRQYMQILKDAGATLSSVLIDYEEYYNRTAWGLFQCGQTWPFARPCAQVDAEIRAIENHPDFASTILAPLQLRGFQYINGNLRDSLIAAAPAQNRDLWDHMIRDLITDQLNRTFRDAVLAVFPDVLVSNYQFTAMNSVYTIPNDSGWHWYRNGSLPPFGTAGGPSMYGTMSQFIWLTYPYTDYLAPTPFHALLMEQSDLRIAQNSDSQALTPWLADRSIASRFTELNPSYPEPLCYYENVLHALASGVTHFNLWNPDASSSDAGERALNATLKEFDRIIGGAVVAHYTQEILDPHADFILSGFFANRYIYRYTPKDLDPAAHIVEGASQVSITSGAVELQFSGGRIVHIPNSLATGGAWIVSPQPVQIQSAAQ